MAGLLWHGGGEAGGKEGSKGERKDGRVSAWGLKEWRQKKGTSPPSEPAFGYAFPLNCLPADSLASAEPYPAPRVHSPALPDPPSRRKLSNAFAKERQSAVCMLRSLAGARTLSAGCSPLQGREHDVSEPCEGRIWESPGGGAEFNRGARDPPSFRPAPPTHHSFPRAALLLLAFFPTSPAPGPTRKPHLRRPGA